MNDGDPKGAATRFSIRKRAFIACTVLAVLAGCSGVASPASGSDPSASSGEALSVGAPVSTTTEEDSGANDPNGDLAADADTEDGASCSALAAAAVTIKGGCTGSTTQCNAGSQNAMCCPTGTSCTSVGVYWTYSVCDADSDTACKKAGGKPCAGSSTTACCDPKATCGTIFGGAYGVCGNNGAGTCPANKVCGEKNFCCSANQVCKQTGGTGSPEMCMPMNNTVCPGGAPDYCGPIGNPEITATFCCAKGTCVHDSRGQASCANASVVTPLVTY